MRASLAEPRHVDIKPRTRGERRRISLHRGVDRWHQDVLLYKRPRARVALIALTVVEDDPMVARGAIRDFWKAFRDTYGRRAYFSWAELQRRGAIHYHAMIVDPPWRLERQARAWLKAHWKLSTLTPDYQLRDGRWFVSVAGDYVRSYVKKPRGTAWSVGSYQQDYDDLPRELRTWSCNRLSERVARLDQHRDRLLYVCTRPMAPWSERMLHIWAYDRQLHWIPRGGVCTLAKNVKPSGWRRRAPRIRRKLGVDTTKRSAAA